MSVPKHKRTLSEMEFYHQAKALRKDIVINLIVKFEEGLYSNKFETENGTVITTVEKYPEHVVTDIRNQLFRLCNSLMDSITMANSIYPSTIQECIVRRNFQNQAIGVCNSIMTELEFMCDIFPMKAGLLMGYADRIDHLQKLLRRWKQTTAKMEKGITKSKEIHNGQ